MNTTLPPARDLPPGRHAELRDAVLTAVAPHRSRRWAAPLVAAAAATVAVGVIAWFAPWGTDAVVPAGDQPVATPTTTPTTTPITTPTVAIAAVPGVDPGEVAAIEKGCGESSLPAAELTLRQVITDGAGRLALLTAVDRTANAESMVVCELDGPVLKYNAGFAGVDPFTGPVSLDLAQASAGGDVKGGSKPEYAGRHGADEVAGRVSPEVAKVTVSQGRDTVDAVIAEGTYLARIVHPTDWAIPENRPAPTVRAYDKNGTLLGEIGP